jgi:hypothetical protein
MEGNRSRQNCTLLWSSYKNCETELMMAIEDFVTKTTIVQQFHFPSSFVGITKFFVIHHYS